MMDEARGARFETAVDAEEELVEAAVVFEEELVAMESCEAHVTSLITLATAKVKQVWKKFV